MLACASRSRRGRGSGGGERHRHQPSKVFLLILSGESAESTQIAREAERARRAGLGIVPLRIEPVEPGDGLNYHIAGAATVDALQPPLSAHLDQLTAIVGRMLEGGEGAPLRPLTMPPQPMKRAWRPRRGWLPIAVAGAVGVAAIAAVAALAVR